MRFELTEQQLSNLRTFLQRVQLTGSEVGAFVEIINTLSNNRDSEKEEV